MAKTFSAQVEEHVRNYKKRLEATFKASAQDVAEEVTKTRAEGGHMRVDTGFLRASLQASNEQMPLIDDKAKPPRGAGPNSISFDADATGLVIADSDLGDTIFLGFTAAYARPREYLDGFVRLAAQNWQKIVARNAAKAVKAFR